MRIVLAAALLLAFALPLRAQEADDAADGAADSIAAAKHAVAFRIDGPAPHIDGKLDDPIWRTARPIADFIQKDPNEGAAPSERTEVAFAYDDDAFYIGARM